MRDNVILCMDSVYKVYGTKEEKVNALNNVNLEIRRGSFTAVMGNSASGKSTLLNVISTVDSVTSGNIYINNSNITNFIEEEKAKFRKESLGFIFQEYNLLDNMTIYENIALSLIINDYEIKIIKKKVNEICEIFGISEVINKFPYEVSGGQRQRCACARAIVSNPDIILADEPTGALDSNSTKTVMETMVKMNKEFGISIIMVTHDFFAASYCEEIVFIKDGRIKDNLRRNGINQDSFFKKIIDATVQIEGV